VVAPARGIVPFTLGASGAPGRPRHMDREREGRLASIGGVTSAIVHDVRNPLTSMRRSAQRGAATRSTSPASTRAGPRPVAPCSARAVRPSATGQSLTASTTRSSEPSAAA
jgi:hypothetical protein